MSTKTHIVEPCGCVRWLFGRDYCAEHRPPPRLYIWRAGEAAATRKSSNLGVDRLRAEQQVRRGQIVGRSQNRTDAPRARERRTDRR